jgi:hypothetical protein
MRDSWLFGSWNRKLFCSVAKALLKRTMSIVGSGEKWRDEGEERNLYMNRGDYPTSVIR